MRILLVEDDEAIAQALVTTLKHQNHVVDVATDGLLGLELAEAFDYDLLLLDVMLPKLDGISLCRKLRTLSYQMPILLLTAKDSTEDKVKGLDAGADDYLVKPFDLPELTARIRALLRRGTAPLPPVLEWGALQLNPSNCDVTYNNQPVTLTPTEYRLLELFMRNSTRVYSRSAILDHLWSFDEPPSEDTIRAHIKGLRQKLKCSGAPADAIETVYGLGYRLKPQSEEKVVQTPRILMGGFSDELGFWLQQRLGDAVVRVTHTGEDTRTELSDRQWSLVILDQHLRHPGPAELLKHIGNKGQSAPPIPVIYCGVKGVDSYPRAPLGKGRKLPETRNSSTTQQQSETLDRVTSFLYHPLDAEKLAREVAKLLHLNLSDPQGSPKQDPTIVAAIGQVWERFKDRIADRVTAIEQATQALEDGELPQELHAKAKQEAHKLAGSLGTFGLTQGSVIAREVEQLLHNPTLNSSQSAHLAVLVQALRSQIDQAPIQSERRGGTPLNDLPLLLMIEGDQELSQQMGLEVKGWGMEVVNSDSIASARTAIADRRPDAVLLDLSAQDTLTINPNNKEEGLTLLSELANGFPPLPVLVVADQSRVEDRLEVARLGGRAFLQKPVRPAQIMEAVVQVLQGVQTTEAKIMVVDDDPQILSLVKHFLQPWGMKTITLSDSERFWETLEVSSPDLLILDIELPHLNGIELCQVVRNDPRWNSLPVLFLTAHTGPDIVHQVFAAGADDYISKPIVGPELVTRLLNRLERIHLLRNMAETDPLTGVANRRKSITEFDKFLHLCQLHGQPMCLAMLDLDRFKQVNDLHGHAMGDAVLRQFGKLLRNTFRSEDIVARWGGEEFVVGMYGINKESGTKRLSEVVQILHAEPFVIGEERLYLTFSGGVAQYPEDGKTVDTLYRCADQALYQAKTAGRDRIIAYNPSGEAMADYTPAS
ncbi:response regulator [Laspinema olomoucense]|uniref:Response regulator n=1 Tax=Laspinema olomoucense D3b TaxID=2953688 RepID=A0ABT2N837_9CYAN|nr:MULTISPECIES: response regulator [unclassified Laspinema]MCT7978837.1 response regulator [Laspinema sp. D3b]MCT7996431.1 response regulator [Laspinema sp. D3c]